MLRSWIGVALGLSSFMVGCTGGENTTMDGTDTPTSSSTTMPESSSDTDDLPDSSTASADTGAPDGPTYRAELVPGTPAELRIMKREDDIGRCTWLILTDQSLGLLAISSPPGWNARAAYTNDTPSSCDVNPGSSGSRQASGGSGRVTAVAEGTASPCTLEVEATIAFDNEDFLAMFSVSDLAVAGCQ